MKVQYLRKWDDFNGRLVSAVIIMRPWSTKNNFYFCCCLVLLVTLDSVRGSVFILYIITCLVMIFNSEVKLKHGTSKYPWLYRSVAEWQMNSSFWLCAICFPLRTRDGVGQKSKKKIYTLNIENIKDHIIELVMYYKSTHLMIKPYCWNQRMLESWNMEMLSWYWPGNSILFVYLS